MSEATRVGTDETRGEPEWRARLFEAAPILFAALAFESGGWCTSVASSFTASWGCARSKDKFHPRWEPRYIAAPGAWTLPIVLAEVAVLTNGPRGD